MGGFLIDSLDIPQATEWQRIGNQVDAATVATRSDFVNRATAHEIPRRSNLAEARLNRKPVKDLRK